MPDKILLIRPQNVYNYNNYPPLNLISIGTSLKKAGFYVKIINCAFEKDSLATIKNELNDALMVCISLITSEAPDAYTIARYVKENSPVPIVAGGWHCTLFPEQMNDSIYIDYVVTGEGELHAVRIAQALQRGEAIKKGIFQRELLNLDELPLTEYDIDEHIEQFMKGYLTDKLSEYVAQPMRWLPYESSRGCPSLCTFCINTVAGNTRYRQKSAGKVIEEVSSIVEKYHISHLKIIDDNFFVDIKRVREICKGMIERDLNITWDGECRCDYFNDRMLNDETLALCKRSGLVQLTLGIESGSPRTLKMMKKGITPEQAEYAVRKCNEYGIIARSSFILEIPGETIDDIRQTIALINKLRRYRHFTCGVGTFRPYPKCELTEKLLAEGYLTEPASFEAWTNKGVVDMYTSAEFIRPWQVNGEYSESVAYYLNMESAVRLGNHQINGYIDGIKNSTFKAIAKLRNRFMYYDFPFDKKMYKDFLSAFYAKRQNLEKSGSYPLSNLRELEK